MNTKAVGKIDYILAFVVLALVLFGVIMIASIGVPKSIELTTPSGVAFPTCSMPEVDCYLLLKKHIVRALIGLVCFVLFIRIPYLFWRKVAILGFIVCIGALISVLIVGNSFSTFANAWLVVYNSSLQPVEFVKLGLIFYLAYWLESRGKDVEHFQKGFLSFCTITGLIVLLLIFQPDLGSIMLVTIISVGMYFLAGAKYKHILGGFLATVLLMSLLIPNMDYLKYRFLSYINPTEQNCIVGNTGETRDYCWQSEQANIAIASGGFLGKGLTKGVQKSYWLPQAADDFIFAASAEELGFWRISFVIFAFLLIAYRGFLIARYAPDRFSMFTAVGITLWITGQAFINIAVNTGVLPITGITLPFISYGGSSLVATLMGVGVLLNISKFTPISSYVPSSTNRRRDTRPRYSQSSTD